MRQARPSSGCRCSCRRLLAAGNAFVSCQWSFFSCVCCTSLRCCNEDDAASTPVFLLLLGVGFWSLSLVIRYSCVLRVPPCSFLFAASFIIFRGEYIATHTRPSDCCSCSPCCAFSVCFRDSTQAEGPRFESASALLSLRKLRSVDAVLFVTLSLTFNETLKWLSSMPVLMQESFWW